MVNTKGVFNVPRDSFFYFWLPPFDHRRNWLIMVSTTEITVKVDELVEKDADTVDSDIRYMAYGARLRTALRASTRYVAYVCSVLVLLFLVQIKHVPL